MTKLKELYDDKMNFQASKSRLEKEFMAEVGRADEVITKIADLKNEKRLTMARIDLEILQLTAELASEGVPQNKSQKVNYVKDKMREAKFSVKINFEKELRRRYADGATIPDLVRECGAPHPAAFYSLLKQPVSPELEKLEEETDNKLIEYEWDYVDNRGAHRYAFNKERNTLRYHGVDSEKKEEVIVSWPERAYLKGSSTLIPELEEKRALMALEILEGTYTGAVFNAPNPYRKD